MKKALMIVAIVAIIAITSSLIYYFVFFKPGIAKAEIRLQEEKLQQEKYLQAQEFLDQASKEKQVTANSIAKEVALNDCLDQAFKEYQRRFEACSKDYNEAWDAACKKLNLPPKSDLPTIIAEPIQKHYDEEIARTDEAYTNDKNDCYKQYGK